MDKKQKFVDIINSSNNIVFFGGAGVSTKHAGFVVNNGGATAEDVREVLRQVSDIVFEKSGIRLEPEVRIW